MKFKLFPYETAVKIGKIMLYEHPLFHLPSYLFGQTYDGKLCSDPNIIEIDNDGIHFYTPICFISEILP